MTSGKMQFSIQKTIDESFEDLTAKIVDLSVTAEDFNNFIGSVISESQPKSTVERVQRKVRNSLVDKHIDNPTGHQPLSLPSLPSRVVPKAQTTGSEQMDHEGEAGHKRSTKTQARNRFHEAVEFIIANQGKEISESDLHGIVDRPSLAKLAISLAREPNSNVSWLLDVAKKAERYDATQSGDGRSIGEAAGDGN